MDNDVLLDFDSCQMSIDETGPDLSTVLSTRNTNGYGTRNRTVLNINSPVSNATFPAAAVPDTITTTVSDGITTVTETVSDHDAHCHIPLPKTDKTARNQLIIVSILCFAFMCVEIVGGILSNSLALITDATHLASDLSSFFVGLFAIWLSKKPATMRMSYGFHRADVLGAMISILIIWALTGVLIYLAIDRLLHPEYDIDAQQMLIVACLGVGFNIVMGIVLSGTCCNCRVEHGHSHFGGSGHSHGNTHGTSSQTTPHSTHSHGHSHGSSQNMNVRAALIHVLGDLIQSIGVLIAAIIIMVNPDYKIADPICTFIFSILVLITTITVARDIFYIIMEAAPGSINYKQIKLTLEDIPGVKSAHSLHAWGLTMSKTAISVHLAINEDETHYSYVVKRASRMLRDDFGAYHVTVQVEPYQEDAMKTCDQCQGPKMK